jgi:hypothetical protein
MSVYDEITQAIIAELDLFIHPERWPHEGLLPVVRRGGNPIYCSKDAGIVMSNNLCRVWTDVYLGDTNPEEGIPVDYMTTEELLKDWSID